MAKTIDRKRAQLERQHKELTEISRWIEVVAEANGGDTRQLDAYLKAAQWTCLELIVGDGGERAGILPTDPDIRIRLAEQRTLYNWIGAFRTQLSGPDKKAEELRAKMADLEIEIDEMAQRGKRDLTEL